MKRNFAVVTVIAFFIAFSFITHSVADNGDINIPITAEQAFDAVTMQVDPVTGQQASVALVDLRTKAEYYWVGACAKVNSIVTTSDNAFKPFNGKVKLKWGKYLSFKVEYGNNLRDITLPVNKIKKIDTEEIALHIPRKKWNNAACAMTLNDDFAAQMDALRNDYNVLILLCRSGKRSNDRSFSTEIFDAVYEIDQPDGSDGQGGFQGSSFGNAYNGFRGYPGRRTRMQSTTSVSWSDAGLPIQIGGSPVTIALPEED